LGNDSERCAKRVRASALHATIGLCFRQQGVPDNVPTPTKGIVIFVMLCLFVFGLWGAEVGTCEKVAGQIGRVMWCKLWSKAVSG
jgi:hypothetical protein